MTERDWAFVADAAPAGAALAGAAPAGAAPAGAAPADAAPAGAAPAIGAPAAAASSDAALAGVNDNCSCRVQTLGRSPMTIGNSMVSNGSG